MVFSNHLYWSKEFKEWGYVILCIKSVFLGQKHFVYRFVWLLRAKLDTLFLQKNFIQYEQKISPIVGKIGIPFRHLIAKWESNHQMGVGAQPDQSLIKSRKCMHKKSTIVKIYTILAFSIDENISNINKLSAKKSLNIKTFYRLVFLVLFLCKIYEAHCFRYIATKRDEDWGLYHCYLPFRHIHYSIQNVKRSNGVSIFKN